MTAACGWDGDDPAYVDYHDTEWGVPERDPRRLFEFVLLEGAQAGLSWSTILHKREGYARCFAGFDPELVAAFGPDDEARCLADPGIVRNRAKVAAAIGNARAWLELDDPVAFLWDFVDGAPVQNHWTALERAAGQHARVGGDEQGAEAARLPLRRPDHLLRARCSRAASSTTT